MIAGLIRLAYRKKRPALEKYEYDYDYDYDFDYDYDYDFDYDQT